jgi:negative regulator of flagellin synthesis FlgM
VERIAMTNKITGYGTTQPAVTQGSRSNALETQGEAAKAANTPPAAAADSVRLTDSARQLQKLADAIANVPVADEARVAAIKEAIAQNVYQVNPEKIADKLLQSDRELVGR